MNKKNKFTQELLKLIAENPELEIKFFISGELQEDDNSWFVGDITQRRNGSRFNINNTCVFFENIWIKKI